MRVCYESIPSFVSTAKKKHFGNEIAISGKNKIKIKNYLVYAQHNT